MNEPEWLLHCQRILALPDKRYVKRSVTFLDGPEIAALLAAPDRSTRTGRRDHILLLVALQTGLRASELTGLRRRDLVLGTGAHVRCLGKGRKERCTPLRRDTAKALQNWLKEWRSDDDGPLFTSIRGDPLSRDALEHLVRKHCLTAARSSPSLASKREIGRVSCRERVCQYVLISVVAGSLKTIKSQANTQAVIAQNNMCDNKCTC